MGIAVLLVQFGRVTGLPNPCGPFGFHELKRRMLALKGRFITLTWQDQVCQ
jgi:hypothetical protein